MRRLRSGWQPVLSDAEEEAARDLVARAQAALLDEHRAGAERQLLALYDLVVGPLDAWVRRQAGPGALSAAVGLPGLWDELPDLDVERESIEELLVFHAGQAGATELPEGLACVPAATEEERQALGLAVAAALSRAPLPRSRWWRRMARRRSGSLGDVAHVTVQRGSEVVLERPPPGPAAPQPLDAATDLGELRDGDRLTLRWMAPVPGQVAVLHAVGDPTEARLSLLLPDGAGEVPTRRAGELIEVVGELQAVVNPDGSTGEHGLLLILTSELLPPTWPDETVARRQLPPEARVWLYRYRVAPALPAGAAT